VINNLSRTYIFAGSSASSLSDEDVERLTHAQLGHRAHYGTSADPVPGTASTSATPFRYDPARNQKQKRLKAFLRDTSIDDTVFKREYIVELVRKSGLQRLRVISSVRCYPLLHACQGRIS